MTRTCWITYTATYVAHTGLHPAPSHRPHLSVPVPSLQTETQTNPVTKQVKLWTPETESTLQDCFAQTDWDVFKATAILEESSVSIQNYAEYVTGYISTCVDNIVPTIQVKKFPNQKPWINSRVQRMLRARSTAFKSGNEMGYKAAKYGLRRAITAAKRQYFSSADSGRMWKVLQQITEHRNTTSFISSSDSLPDDLIYFYTRFKTTSEITGSSYYTWPTQPPASSPPTVSSVQVLNQPLQGSRAGQHP